jgi:hypothetical protein
LGSVRSAIMKRAIRASKCDGLSNVPRGWKRPTEGGGLREMTMASDPKQRAPIIRRQSAARSSEAARNR